MRPPLEVVIKISKHCNLRCTYCYEYEELSNKQRMSLDNIQRLFDSFGQYLDHENHSMDFIWHGGEPLLIKPSYYEEIRKIQNGSFGPDGSFRNLTQTNLTILTDEILDMLRSKTFFAGFGVSVDPFGNERVDIRGRARNEHVFGNMQRLIDNDVDFGAITVLTRGTLPQIEPTFAFFDTLGIDFRALPFYKSISSEQYAAHALTNADIVFAYRTLFDLWLVSENAVRIQPIHEYIHYALRFIKGTAKRYLNMQHHESWFIIGLDGNVWGQPNTYEPGTPYGNIFEEDFEAILASRTRRRLCREAADRCAEHCMSCPYYGYCPGAFVMSATAEERMELAVSGCPVRQVIDHIVERFDERGLSAQFSAAAEPLSNDERDAVTAAIGRA